MTHSLTFDAVSEPLPGPKWRARWDRSWPAYRAWFTRPGLPTGPDRAECEAALAQYMPELVSVHRDLTRVAGGGDMATRFLSTWCPPPYLGGCSVAALHDAGSTRLVRNYDLSPDLNEGLLLHSAWRKPVMGMVEFLWGLSDGINADGLAVALAFGGSTRSARGFGICTLLRYVLETCATVDDAIAVLDRVPSHMDYNLVLADASGRTASVEVYAGGGTKVQAQALATNHQIGRPTPPRAAFTRTLERRMALLDVMGAGHSLDDAEARFLADPLFQHDYANGFGTLFTAAYNVHTRSMRLRWPERHIDQSLDAFRETSRTIDYTARESAPPPAPSLDALIRFVPDARRDAAAVWLSNAQNGTPDWQALGGLFVPETAAPPDDCSHRN